MLEKQKILGHGFVFKRENLDQLVATYSLVLPTKYFVRPRNQTPIVIRNSALWLNLVLRFSIHSVLGSNIWSYHFFIRSSEIGLPTQPGQLQWGSEMRTSLDFKWSIRGWVPNGLEFECNLKSRSPTICNPDNLPPFYHLIQGYGHFQTNTKFTRLGIHVTERSRS